MTKGPRAHLVVPFLAGLTPPARWRADRQFALFLEDIFMKLRAPRLVLAGAALALAAVVIAGAAFYPRSRQETAAAPTSSVHAAGQDRPTVSFWHVWTDE